MKNKYLLVIPLLFIVALAGAQPPTPPATPIDGGLSALLAGGVLYGISRIKKLRKE